MPELETITAALAKGYKQLEPNSFRTSAELTSERRTNNELRRQPFYTANFGMYSVEDKEAILYFGGREANPILANIDEVCSQLIKTGNYKIKPKDNQAVKDSVKLGNTLKVKLSNLDLEKHNDEFSFFKIDTADYASSLSKHQRALAERIYGQGNDFAENMKMLSKAGISKTRVYVLNQDYVKKHAKKAAVARASWLYCFDYSSDFLAVGRDVDNHLALRGVRKGVAEGDSEKIIPTFAKAYQSMLNGAGVLHTPNGDYVLAKGRVN